MAVRVILKNPTTMVIDRHTGKARKKDMKRSRVARKAARHRIGKPVSARVRLKISKSLLRVHRTGKTTTGRKAHIVKGGRKGLIGKRHTRKHRKGMTGCSKTPMRGA